MGVYQRKDWEWRNLSWELLNSPRSMGKDSGRQLRVAPGIALRYSSVWLKEIQDADEMAVCRKCNCCFKKLTVNSRGFVSIDDECYKI